VYSTIYRFVFSYFTAVVSECDVLTLFGISLCSHPCIQTVVLSVVNRSICHVHINQLSYLLAFYYLSLFLDQNANKRPVWFKFRLTVNFCLKIQAFLSRADFTAPLIPNEVFLAL